MKRRIHVAPGERHPNWQPLFAKYPWLKDNPPPYPESPPSLIMRTVLRMIHWSKGKPE